MKMCAIQIWLLCFFVVQINDRVEGVNELSRACILPPHPSFGQWSYINPPSHSSSRLQVPEHAILKINCEETFKLDGSPIAACINRTWIPNIGKCLKTCPSIYSTLTTNVKCIYKGEETINCTEPTEGTLAQFKCASFYEDPRLFRSKAVCHNGKWSENIPECTPVCGRTVEQDPTLIVRGSEAKKEEFPWQVALYTLKDKVLICGGTLLSERVVLTAAHCVSADNNNIYPKDNYLIMAGKYYRDFDHPDDRQQRQASEIHEIFVSERYEGDVQNFEGDIAIIITKRRFKFSATIQPVCIDWDRKFENVVLGTGEQKGFVSGWGYTKPNAELARELRSLTVPSIPRYKCRHLLPEDYRRYLTLDKFCAGYKDNGSSVCGGDSGGGLVFKGEGRFFIAGIVSLAPRANTEEGGCNSQHYGIYTLVYNYTDNFILKKLAEFKSLDIIDEDCKNCTTPTNGSTETPSLNQPQLNGCILPQHPESGTWSFPELSISFSPGNPVPPDTVIKANCNIEHQYNGEDTIVCSNGNWSSKIGKCLKTCPPFNSLLNMNVTCTHNDKILDNCTDAVDGTLAKFECGPFYEFTTLASKPSLCINGKWSFIPECEPACGYLPVNYSAPGSGYPWQVSVVAFEDDQLPQICDGNLIGSKIVVTAAWCMRKLYSNKIVPAENVTVFAGDLQGVFKFQVPFLLPFRHKLRVKEILLPRQFLDGNQPNAGDIALLILSSPLALTKTVQPVCIDWSREIPFPFDKYGIAKSKSMLLPQCGRSKYRLIPFEECTLLKDEFHTYFLSNDKFCGQVLINTTNSSPPCVNILGTGLTFEHHNRYYLAGILSSGRLRQTSRRYTLFTNVSLYTDDFILNAKLKYKD